MKKVCILFLFAIIANEAMGMTFRHKRQATDNEEDENTLDDRYGWDGAGQRQNRRPRPGQGRPRQWQRPNQEQQDWERPNQEQQDWERPNQGQQDWQRPNQGQQDWQRPNQGQQDWQRPNQQQPGGQQPRPTQRPNGNGNSQQQATVTADCVRNCPATSEYNPVCGNDGVTYDNPGRLGCAQQCGVNVVILRASRCPSTTTPAPN